MDNSLEILLTNSSVVFESGDVSAELQAFKEIQLEILHSPNPGNSVYEVGRACFDGTMNIPVMLVAFLCSRIESPRLREHLMAISRETDDDRKIRNYRYVIEAMDGQWPDADVYGEVN